MWAVEQDVLPPLTAKGKYSRHFSQEYYGSLPDGVHNCALARDGTRLWSALEEEAAAKEVGLMSAMGDKDAWFAAKRNYDHLLRVFDAIALACAGDI